MAEYSSPKLEGHFTGKDKCLEMSIIIPPSEDEPQGLLLPNPEYDIWIAAVKLLVGWLYNSMTVEMASQVTGHDRLMGGAARLLWAGSVISTRLS